MESYVCCNTKTQRDVKELPPISYLSFNHDQARKQENKKGPPLAKPYVYGASAGTGLQNVMVCE